MDPKNEKTIESFIRSFEKVNDLIREEKPDCLVAPMFGAVPFIDILNIIDDEFPNDFVEYVPASNKVYKVRDVLRGAFLNLIKAYAPNGGSFLSIDEVVSGNSLTRVYKQFNAARMDYANKKTKEIFGNETDFTKENVRKFRDELVDSISYKSIGIVDSKLERLNKVKHETYLDLLKEGVVLPVKVDCIVTMDRMDFFPAKYKIAYNDQDQAVFLPVVSDFQISPVYVDFLAQVAGILGKDPQSVTMRNMVKIRNSYHLVPEDLRKL